ncbi:hypothetical protein [Metabacillus iocasae]|uniref:Na+-driven multidrug efflux pump n=1 Tax=Priestia iocasae TaxID=2291674 RepID=A0ABS2QZF9_9BACI|nr:hypothetical protein [Metabacillus iocasae]MBM7703834.1 Na+-driven multidrug efflux pump [Metabacillus iocasae]
MFTTIDSVLLLTHEYKWWMILFPFVAFWGLMLNGIFSGATEARPIRDSLILSLLVFIASLYVFVSTWDNHGLWFSFILFTLARSVFLAMFTPKLSKKVIQSDFYHSI